MQNVIGELEKLIKEYTQQLYTLSSFVGIASMQCRALCDSSLKEVPMQKVIVVTDSIVCLTDGMVKQYGIKIASVNIF